MKIRRKILAVRIIIIVIDKMWENLYFCIVELEKVNTLYVVVGGMASDYSESVAHNAYGYNGGGKPSFGDGGGGDVQDVLYTGHVQNLHVVVEHTVGAVARNPDHHAFQRSLQFRVLIALDGLDAVADEGATGKLVFRAVFLAYHDHLARSLVL